jgi:hypothetical protein
MARLQDSIPAWPAATLAQRLEDARVLLSVHRFLRESENARIRASLKKRWEAEASATLKVPQ